MSVWSIRSLALNCGFWLAAAAVCLGAAEITARTEDRIRSGVPFLAVPDHDRDLVVHDEFGIHGKPNGRFKRWHLNRFGFRSPEMSDRPAEGCIRVMTLGASETFGLFESDGHEYPAQLEQFLAARRGCYEVANAAVAGLTVRGIIRLWTGWASRFQPQIVTIYPTPAFYLGEGAPGFPAVTPPPPPPPLPWWTPRLLDRARDRFDYPDFIQRIRVARLLAAEERPHAPDWFFQQVPQGRLDQFHEDLVSLVRAIELTGARPILMTHATAFHRPPLPSELNALTAWRTVRPRPTASVLLEFEDAARQATLDAARETGIPVIDLSGHLSGERRWFADDYLHFSDDGAREVARLMADCIETSQCGTPRALQSGR